MGGQQHRRAGLVEFDEQAQQPAGKGGVHIARGLVGEQEFRPADQRAGDGGALLLAAGEDGRQHMHAVAEADPAEQFGHLGAVAGLLFAQHTQGQRDILVGGEVIQQAEILEHDADAPAQHRHLVRIEGGDIPPEQGDETARGLQRQEQKAHEGGLAGARGAGEKLERMGWMPKDTSFSTSCPIPYLRPTFSNRTNAPSFRESPVTHEAPT